MDFLNIPKFMPRIQQYFSHFLPTVRLLALRDPQGMKGFSGQKSLLVTVVVNSIDRFLENRALKICLPFDEIQGWDWLGISALWRGVGPAPESVSCRGAKPIPALDPIKR